MFVGSSFDDVFRIYRTNDLKMAWQAEASWSPKDKEAKKIYNLRFLASNNILEISVMLLS